jgi:hypothetical protein
MSDKIDYPIARKYGSRRIHTVYAAGGPEDGSLYGMRTFCGLKIEHIYDDSNLEGVGMEGWIELDRKAPRDHSRDCKRCGRTH